MDKLYVILDNALTRNASDIHLLVGCHPMLRVAKELVSLKEMSMITEEEQREFELAYYANFLGMGYVKVSDEEKEFCDDYYNENYEYKLENEEKIIALYDKYFVLPYFEEALNND